MATPLKDERGRFAIGNGGPGKYVRGPWRPKREVGQSRFAVIRMLRAYRFQNDIQQTEVARRAGYDRKLLSRWETGAATPGLKALCDWAAALDCELDLTMRRQR